MNRILLVGCNGSQGKRYQAILNYLQVAFTGVDIGSKLPVEKAEHYTGFIIATPTDTHIAMLKLFLEFKRPILCEKPITKDLKELKDLKPDRFLTMVYQYRHLVSPYSEGPSYYDYFRHGNDGLVWDCLQIIALSKQPPVLEEESPIWDCAINGKYLNLSEMDWAYVQEIERWLGGEKQSFAEIIDIHEKVKAYEGSY